MKILVYVLLLFDLDCPETLHSFLWLRRGVIVASVGIRFRDAEGEQGEGEEFKYLGFGGLRSQFWEKGVLGASFGVGGRVNGTECTFHYESDQPSTIYLESGVCTSKHILPLPVQYARPSL